MEAQGIDQLSHLNHAATVAGAAWVVAFMCVVVSLVRIVPGTVFYRWGGGLSWRNGFLAWSAIHGIVMLGNTYHGIVSREGNAGSTTLGLLTGMLHLHGYLVASILRFSKALLSPSRRKWFCIIWSSIITIWTVALIIYALVNVWKDPNDADKIITVFAGLTYTFLCLFYPLVYIGVGLYSFTLPLWRIDQTIAGLSSGGGSSKKTEENRTFEHLIRLNNLCMLVGAAAIVLALVCKFVMSADDAVRIVLQNSTFDLLTLIALFAELIYEYASQLAQLSSPSLSNQQSPAGSYGAAAGSNPVSGHSGGKGQGAVGVSAGGTRVAKSVGEGDETEEGA
ncbi:hypothetical protein HK097_001984 [Rhizophlyctis rosea]|uniref:Uncharacterized protein n=1 Tax=Rhizophlyctis rosea TaxID=64517 RepID=A0AAD5SJ13_9FUNG|nr:hypothetical protein HK097_001984 [Rhizophlyctis rosea]